MKYSSYRLGGSAQSGGPPPGTALRGGPEDISEQKKEEKCGAGYRTVLQDITVAKV